MRGPSRMGFRGLLPRLFASHLVVALVGTLTFLVAVSVVAPLLFGNLMQGPMGPSHMMSMGQMMDSVFRAFARTLLYSLAVAAVAAIAVAAVTGMFVARRIVGPLRAMSRATRRIAAGRYDERVPVRGDDELGELAESLNAMARTLQATEQRRLDLISDVSHELRTPLTVIEGYMDGLIDGVVEPSEETWSLVRAEAGRLHRLVDEMQELSRAEAGGLPLHLREVSPREVVEQAAGLLGPLFAEKGVRMEVSVPEDLPPVLADRDRVVQVLDNLLSNALKYTPSGGEVSLSARRAKDEVSFRVTDSGEGIAPEHLPHLFERFYRVEGSRSRENGGVGVGLTICRTLVEAMGGRIHAESAGPGRGAAFEFTLPVAPRRES